MRVATLATAAAIALSAAIGSVSAADQFTTLNGVRAVRMSSGELAAVKGMDHHFRILTPGSSPNVTADGFLNPPASDSADPLTDPQAGRFETDHYQDANGGGNFITITRNDGKLMEVAPSYNGLANACGNGVIVMPGFITC